MYCHWEPSRPYDYEYDYEYENNAVKYLVYFVQFEQLY